MPIASTRSGCCEKLDRNSESQVIKQLLYSNATCISRINVAVNERSGSGIVEICRKCATIYNSVLVKKLMIKTEQKWNFRDNYCRKWKKFHIL
ncbi:hypothetical protein T4A_3839 [Trichinella pseudospiralis]|uniref:Uncharacterized protein n=1 Tax=Trichinella pseudospiralis TaxID=6337 RepID=A0A0V1EQE4_TRIPS|nr:hypothetical protein T4A_3839 [Trichinella pseudospiralis]